MSSTGNVFPTAGASVSRAATAWTASGEIVSDNTTDATCSSGASGSDYLVASAFGFSIPSDATILGITVRIEASEHTAGTESLNAQLQDGSAALIGSSSAQAINGTAKSVYTYGGTTDVWGATLTPAIVNDPDFGVRMWFTTTHDVRIDYVTIAVEYSIPLPTGTCTASVNPVLRKQRGLMHIGQALLLTTLAVVASTATVRAPLVTRIPARQPSPQLLVPNLLTSTMAPVVAAPFRQSDWPNPVLRKYQQPQVYQSPLLTILASTAPVGPETVFRDPFVPRTARFKQEWPAPNLLLSTLSAPIVASPFVPGEFLNPKGNGPHRIGIASQASVWTNPLHGVLKGQDAFFAGAGSAPDYDWPNPQGRVYPSALRTWQGALPPAVEEEPPAATAVVRPPLTTRFNAPSSRASIAAQSSSRLLDLLAVTQAAIPFAQRDWPTPRGKAAAISLRTWSDPLKINLIGQDAYGQFVDIQSTWIRRPNIGLRTWTNSLLQSTLSAPVPRPFTQSDWPIPKGPTHAIANLGCVEQTKLNLIGQDAVFHGAGRGPVYDWPNPYSLRRPVGDVGQRPSVLAVSIVPAPFLPAAWPNPQGNKYSARGWEQNLLGTTLAPTETPEVMPFSQPDWKVTRRVDSGRQGFTATRFAGLVQVTVPFGPLSWPNPYALRRVAVGYFDQKPIVLVEAAEAAVPFSAAAWPNPRTLPRSSNGIAGATPIALNAAVATSVDPFSLHEWPVPTGKPHALSLRGWLHSPFGIEGERPFSQHDWQLPVVAKFVPSPSPGVNFTVRVHVNFIEPPPERTRSASGENRGVRVAYETRVVRVPKEPGRT
jgi:hypothetical protein